MGWAVLDFKYGAESSLILSYLSECEGRQGGRCQLQVKFMLQLLEFLLRPRYQLWKISMGVVVIQIKELTCLISFAKSESMGIA